MTLTVPPMPGVNTIGLENDDFEAVHNLRLWGCQGWDEADRLGKLLDLQTQDSLNEATDNVELSAAFDEVEAERDALRAQVRELAEALEVAQDAMDERRSYVSGGEPSTCWQEMKYGKIWDEEDAKVSAALSRLASAPQRT